MVEDKDKKEKYKRLSWDEYFLDLVKVVGGRGTCDRGRSGCVVARDNRIIVTGYVGSASGLPHCDDIGHEMHTVKQEDGTESKHCIRTAHAEQNAIANAARFGVALDKGTLYCHMTPCYTCAKMIINSGIKKVVCTKDYHKGGRSKEIFKEAGVEYVLMKDEMETYANM